jgi:hypothetical protein
MSSLSNWVDEFLPGFEDPPGLSVALPLRVYLLREKWA